MDMAGQVWHGRKRALPGWLVVVDLPVEAHALVRAAVRNTEIDRLHERVMLEHHLSSRDELRALVALGASALEEIRAVPFACAADSAIRADLTPEAWMAFVDEYLHLVDVELRDHTPEALHRKRRAILERYDVTLPEWMERDSQDWRLPFTVQSLYSYAWRIEGLPTLREMPDRQGVVQGYHFAHALRDFDRMVIEQLPFLRTLMQAFLARHEAEDMDRWLQKAPMRTGLDRLRRVFPPDEARLPLVWRADFPQREDRALWREADVQLLCAPIPPEHIVGAIPLSENRRLRPELRPDRRRGETLESRLWEAVWALKRAQESGRGR